MMKKPITPPSLEEQPHVQANLLQHVLDAVIITDLDFNIQSWNRAAELIYGWPADAVLGKPVSSILQTKTLATSRQEMIDQLFAQGEWKGEAIQRRRDGGLIHILASVSLIKDPQGQPVGVVAINRDINSWKQAEAALQKQNNELSLLNKATQKFILALDLDEVLAVVLDEMRQLLGVQGGSAWLIDPQTQEIVCWQATTPEHSLMRNWRLSPGQGVVGWVAQHGRSLIVADTQADTRHYKIIDQQVGVEMRSLLAVPLLVQQKVIGVLEMVDTTPNRFEATDLELVELMATTAAIAIENAYLFRALGESEKRYRTLFENSAISLWEEDFSQVAIYLEELRQSGVSDFRSHFKQHPEAVIHCTKLVQILDVNQATLEMYHADSKEILLGSLNKHWNSIALPAFVEELVAISEGKTHHKGEVVHYTLTGSKINVDLCWSVLPDYRKSYEKVIVSMHDITARKYLEQQLIKSQKMEAVGHLASGVAHNFNNMLTAIMGYVGMALETLAAGHPAVSDLEGIQKTAERAASLTHQLLTFTRQYQPSQSRVVNLNQLILGIENLLRQTIRANTELILDLEPEPGYVQIDASKFEQVLLNLALNARDAMPHGGSLTITTKNVSLAKPQLDQNGELPAGQYVLVSVADTGLGMTPEIKGHLFEPFFTTKEMGTGLGLATCFGIIQQGQGYILVESEPGEGTIFKIYLPRLIE
jgi:PAS domain S-box-containing protein